MDWYRFLKAASYAGAEKGIRDIRDRVYEVSRELPVEQGLKLIRDFDTAIDYAKVVGKHKAGAYDGVGKRETENA